MLARGSVCLSQAAPQSGGRYLVLAAGRRLATAGLSVPALRPRPGRQHPRSQYQHQYLVLRTYSTSSTSSSSTNKPASEGAADPYHRLRPLIESFDAPIDWAVAYGSGVMKQASSSTPPPSTPSENLPAKQASKEEQPLTDLLIATPSAEAFHAANLLQNPGHYPLYARWMGARGVARVQERWGAGVWYVTMVEVCGVAVKYGVISTSTLEKDLREWTTFYLSGRLQKPVLPLHPPLPSSSPPPSPASSPISTSTPATTATSLPSALTANLHSALTLSLLLLPARFTEDHLWEQIAGLSYSGDPRMSVPGAENPEKVRNIVRGEGAREGFRGMYGGMLQGLGVRWAREASEELNEKEWAWKGEGEGMLEQQADSDTARLSSLASSLPITLRRALLTHYPSPPPSSSPAIPAEAVQDSAFRKVVSEELRKIIHGPALRQSVKGLFTAGLVKSFWYSLAKFNKWLKGRGQKRNGGGR